MNKHVIYTSVLLMNVFSVDAVCDELLLDNHTQLKNQSSTINIDSPRLKNSTLVHPELRINNALDNSMPRSSSNRQVLSFFDTAKTQTKIIVHVTPFETNKNTLFDESNWQNTIALQKSTSLVEQQLVDSIPMTSLIGPKESNSLGLVLGYSLHTPLNYNWQFTSSADIGGYGVNDTISGSINLGVSYKISAHWDVSALYKGSYTEFDNDSTVQNFSYEHEALTHGPVISASFQF